MAAVRTTKILRLSLAAALLAALAGGLLAFAYSRVPAVRQFAQTLPVVQQAGLLVYRLSHPTLAEGRDGDAAARDILLLSPMGVAEDEAGNLFVGDRGKWFGLAGIWRINGDGRARLIAGSGRRGAVEIGGAALTSDLGSPEGLSLDGEGRIYFADSVNHLVLRIETDGRLTRIAGSGRAGFGGDGGPAIEADLNRPFDVRLGSRGEVYIADYENHRIRKVTPDGRIETVAGNGAPGYSGDGGPATAAQLNGPYGIFVDADDSLLIADSFNHVIRRVGPDGRIATLFGSGERGYAGDGGPAKAAAFAVPESLYVDPDGHILIGDELNHAVRLVAPDGRISTLAGTGVEGFSADGALASNAEINDPEYLFSREDGSVVVSEGDNGRVLVIKPDGKLYTLAGRSHRK